MYCVLVFMNTCNLHIHKGFCSYTCVYRDMFVFVFEKALLIKFLLVCTHRRRVILKLTYYHVECPSNESFILTNQRQSTEQSSIHSSMHFIFASISINHFISSGYQSLSDRSCYCFPLANF